MMPIARETRFAPRAQIVRRRLLPVPGRVCVHVGDRVHPRDVVAEAEVAGVLRVVDVARAIRVAPGASVTRGTALASGGLIPRRVYAPCAGTIQGIEEGCVFIREEPRILSLTAYVPGEVVETYPHRGVAIQATGALIRGAWGSGGEHEGWLVVAAQSPADALSWERVSLRHRGAILVGGMLDDPRTLCRASQFRLSGIVVGSLHPRLREACEQSWPAVIVTEGMGSIPMAEPLFDLLRSLHGSAAVLSGAPADNGGPPELIVPFSLDDEAAPMVAPRPLAVGVRVRLTREPYLGAVGQIVGLPESPQQTAIGTQTEGAQVRLSDGRKVFVPLGNLELIE